jgi:antitoxin HigA-1
MARTPIHPGEVLAEQLGELRMTPTALARVLRVPANRMLQIVQGKRNLTADTALRLGHYFGTSPEFWLNLQKSYDLRIAEQRIGKQVADLPRLARERTAQPPAS